MNIFEKLYSTGWIILGIGTLMILTDITTIGLIGTFLNGISTGFFIQYYFRPKEKNQYA